MFLSGADLAAVAQRRIWDTLEQRLSVAAGRPIGRLLPTQYPGRQMRPHGDVSSRVLSIGMVE